MRALGRLVRRLLVGVAAGFVALIGWALIRGAPQDLPWTRLDLGDPVGAFTGRKLAALASRGGECRHLLRLAGVDYQSLPARHSGACGYDDAVRFSPGGARRIAFSPAGVGVECPVAAGLAMWEWQVVQPAAQRRFGSSVTTLEHFGSYSCRRLYGRDTGSWSEHARANALDVAAFRLANGTRISVARDWKGDTSNAWFLRDVRDGACGLFATVLSPDYNAAHADHLHLDQAPRGATGRRACR